ncbi:MAG: hypothetical protein IT548_04460 [Alphaproteobacteria bacterium]|nr:hypothetical protein [Alphaproteobacteria bacterium]
MTDAPPDLALFLARLGDTLDAMTIDGRGLTAVYDPARRPPSAAGEVYVGIGAWRNGEGDIAHGGACLNNKGAAERFGWKREPVTVAAFVRDAPEDLVAQWRQVFGTAPDEVLRATLVVEDASPDSVLSVVFFLARLAGVPSAALPQRWLTSLTAWERDGVAPSVTRSWTSLLSALAHSHFGMKFDGAGIAEAWGDALRFTVTLLRAGADPDAVDADAVPVLLTDPAYGRAIAFAMNEKQDYDQSLARAVRLELLVPMAGSPGRELLVDAYFAVESNAPSGVKKIFIRTDTANTTLHNGFSLMGLYRPGLEGSGNDMTISVDPRSGIALRELWQALEAAEIEKWDGARPNGSPRRIASYPAGGYDQPWWDDHGRYTLLGAPKRVSDAELGSKLSWSDVLEAVWRSYNQLRGLAVYDLGAEGAQLEPKAIEACTARAVSAGAGVSAVTKQLIAVKWNRSFGATQSLQFTPTVKRHLAAMLVRAGKGLSGPVQLADLPESDDFDYLEIAGGQAIVSRDGLFLFDDWRDKDLAAPALGSDFAQAVVLQSDCLAYDAEVDALYESASHGGDVLQRITDLRARIARTFQKADLTEASPERRVVRAAIERRWGLDGKEAGLTNRLKDLQEILETKATLDTQGMATLLAFFTIPAFIGTVLQLYGVIVDNANRGADSNLNFVGYGVWMGLLLVGLSGATMAIAFWMTRKRR